MDATGRPERVCLERARQENVCLKRFIQRAAMMSTSVDGSNWRLASANHAKAT
jgi:hypothetical protein